MTEPRPDRERDSGMCFVTSKLGTNDHSRPVVALKLTEAGLP